MKLAVFDPEFRIGSREPTVAEVIEWLIEQSVDPIPWCSQHDAPWREEIECVLVAPGHGGEFNPCILEEPQQVYRMEVALRVAAEMPIPYECGIPSNDSQRSCERDKGHEGEHRHTTHGYVLTWH